jgi:GTPase SAR1 family protein
MKNKIKNAEEYLVLTHISHKPSSYKEGIENVEKSENANVDRLLLEKSHGFVL